MAGSPPTRLFPVDRSTHQSTIVLLLDREASRLSDWSRDQPTGLIPAARSTNQSETVNRHGLLILLARDWLRDSHPRELSLSVTSLRLLRAACTPLRLRVLLPAVARPCVRSHALARTPFTSRSRIAASSSTAVLPLCWIQVTRTPPRKRRARSCLRTTFPCVRALRLAPNRRVHSSYARSHTRNLRSHALSSASTQLDRGVSST